MEDDAVLADMYVQKFTREGFDIRHALDGEAGLKLVRTKSPDLVLLDIMMPKKNGLDTLKDLKADPALKDINVILLSNVSDQSYLEKGLATGAKSYLLKSDYTPGEIVAKVNELFPS